MKRSSARRPRRRIIQELAGLDQQKERPISARFSAKPEQLRGARLDEMRSAYINP
jgi:hypothetical protein